MNNQGTLLICPNCYEKDMAEHGTYRSFGSISPDGSIRIMRRGNFHRATFIFAKEFTIACNCGYSLYYNNGKVSMEDISTSYHYERNGNNIRI